MSALDAQIGAVEEAAFNVSPTVTKFDEFVKESVKASYARIESNALRPGRMYRSADRFTTNPLGANGDVEVEVASKGFGFWLRQMLGGEPVTTGTATGYTHTFAPASLDGRSFTLQVGRPYYVGAPMSPFTYGGGKVTSWEISNSNDSNVMAKLSCDFASESTAVALAAASYPLDVQTFNWVGGLVTIDGTQFDVTEASVTGSNGLKTDRRYLRNDPTKKEQIGNDYRSGEFSLKADFDSLAHHARVASATAAGAMAETVLKWEAPTVIPGGAIKPSLTITINARFDKFEANVDGPAAIEQSIGGVYLGSSSLSVAYVTADATTLV